MEQEQIQVNVKWRGIVLLERAVLCGVDASGGFLRTDNPMPVATELVLTPTNRSGIEVRARVGLVLEARRAQRGDESEEAGMSLVFEQGGEQLLGLEEVEVPPLEESEQETAGIEHPASGALEIEEAPPPETDLQAGEAGDLAVEPGEAPAAAGEAATEEDRPVVAADEASQSAPTPEEVHVLSEPKSTAAGEEVHVLSEPRSAAAGGEVHVLSEPKSTAAGGEVHVLSQPKSAAAGEEVHVLSEPKSAAAGEEVHVLSQPRSAAAGEEGENNTGGDDEEGNEDQTKRKRRRGGGKRKSKKKKA